MSDYDDEFPNLDSAAVDATFDKLVQGTDTPRPRSGLQAYLDMLDACYDRAGMDVGVDKFVAHHCDHGSEAPEPVIWKRKSAGEIELADQPAPKKLCPEVPWHPLFNQDSPKVTLLSSDNQKLCVDKNLLVTARDMFSIPTNPLSTVQSEPIYIDERADVLALLVCLLQWDQKQDEIEDLEADVTVLFAAVKLHDKFDIHGTRDEVVEDLHTAIHQEPFKIFAIASRQNNLELGRMAIENMRHSPHRTDKFDFWQEVSEATLSWQVALARLLMPKLTLWKMGNDNHNDITALTKIDMAAVAEKFEPTIRRIEEIMKSTVVEE